MVRSRENLVSAYAFLVGVILAVIFGFLTESPAKASGLFYSVLVFIGLIIGFAKESDKDSLTFLFASLALVIGAAMGNTPLNALSKGNFVVDTLRNILTSLLVLFVPVTIIVALKTVFSSAKI